MSPLSAATVPKLLTRRRAWLLVFLLWVAAVLNYLDRQVIFSLFPPLQSELRLSNVELGLLGTVFLWIYGLLSPLGGYLADRFSRRGIIVASLVIWSAVTWATGLAHNFTQLLWARGLLGISEACYLPAALALITQHHGPTRSRAVGLHQSGLAVGTVVAGVGGGWIAEHYGWRAVFTLLGAVGLGYAIFLAAGLLRGAERPAAAAAAEYRPRFGPALRELLGTRNFVALCSVNAISSIAFWIVYAWLPLHLYERFGMSLAEAGFTATFYLQATSLAGVLAGGWLADRWSLVTDRGRLLTQVVGFLTCAPFLFLVGYTHSRGVLVASLVLAGIGRGFYDCNTMPVMCQFTRAELRATGYGVYNAASCLVSGTMTAVAGALKSTLGLGGAIEISAGIVVLCGLYMSTVRFGADALRCEPKAP